MIYNQVQPRVLSVQSHVVSGYCGNKSATFPLQVLGLEVDPINSVQLSNHTQYGKWQGQILSNTDLEQLFEGLQMNNLHKNYTHIVSGYARDPLFLRSLEKIIKNIKEQRPECLYVCDPVLGDAGKLYVPESIAPIYKEIIIPLADVLVPNQFEAEHLTGVTINSIDTAIKAMNVFHTWGVKIVVISSAVFDNEDKLVVLASQKIDANVTNMVKLEIARQKGNYVGTGDLFTALFTGWLSKSKNNITTALENTVCTIQHIIHRTLEMAHEETPYGFELKIIQSKADIEDPYIIAKAIKI